MKWLVFPSSLALSVLLACSAVGFQPAECSSLSPDNQGALNNQLYRDLMRGTYGAEDCFEFRGEVSQSIDGGYVVDTAGFGTTFPGDVFVRWEGDYKFVEGDLVLVVGAVADPLTFETLLGIERTIPAFHGSDIADIYQQSRTGVIAATKQAENLTEYERMTVEELQNVQSCHRPEDIINALLDSADGYEVDKLDLNFSAGPVPDPIVIRPGTIPYIVAEGHYTMVPLTRSPGGTIEYGQITADWNGECWFTEIQINEGIGPTPDANAPQPTYTP